ncbi:unnamed protein product [marine sediment metagenome]|uniref:Uncharacterized protein n=1 Tax=marine sediment metagenome TaxID=412755 RepID=X0WDV5_9ZZZZ
MARGNLGKYLVNDFLNTGVGKMISDSLKRPSEYALQYKEFGRMTGNKRKRL